MVIVYKVAILNLADNNFYRLEQIKYLQNYYFTISQNESIKPSIIELYLSSHLLSYKCFHGNVYLSNYTCSYMYTSVKNGTHLVYYEHTKTMLFHTLYLRYILLYYRDHIRICYNRWTFLSYICDFADCCDCGDL